MLLPDAEPCSLDSLTVRRDRAVPRAVGETHRRYSGYINARLRVTGHLFQGRFGCVAMDESHLMAAFRYVALNPVKAKLAATAAVEWPWSSPALPRTSAAKTTGWRLFDHYWNASRVLPNSWRCRRTLNGLLRSPGGKPSGDH